MRRHYSPLVLIVLATPLILMAAPDADTLRQQIDDRSQQIKKLETEIAAYQKQADETAKQANTLNGQVAELNTTSKTLGTKVELTGVKINKTNLDLKQITGDITSKQSEIERDQGGIQESIRQLRGISDDSPLEMVLAAGSFSQFWRDQEQLANLSGRLTDKINTLRSLKTDLEVKQTDRAATLATLAKLKAELADQQKIADQNRATKATLLAQTKNQEANYQKLLADKQAQKAAFEKELFDFESQLKLVVDPNSLPAAGNRPFAWPLDDVFVTQFFGRTVAAARLYTSGTHNGVDFRAAIGTPVKAVGSGTVTATGNTDLQAGCYSYGQWVLIDHHNGLSSLYGHLSLIKVTPGQSVSGGDLIGYSGKTGYATGPHLHLTIYATDGLEVTKYSNSLHCQNVVIPIAATKAYLDPMLYLPPL